jgi:hypothetical protein
VFGKYLKKYWSYKQYEQCFFKLAPKYRLAGLAHNLNGDAGVE